jgi:molecular chaperone IbpA
VKLDDDHYCIELALAGYSKEDIEISVEKDILTVKSVEEDKDEDTDGLTVIHQGIAKRLWSQKFILGEWMEVWWAGLEDGLLTIKIKREVPEELKPKVITIE